MTRQYKDPNDPDPNIPDDGKGTPNSGGDPIISDRPGTADPVPYVPPVTNPAPTPTPSGGGGRRRATVPPKSAPTVPENPTGRTTEPFDPRYKWRDPVTSSPAERQLTYSGVDGVLNLIYGKVGNIGGTVAEVAALNGGRFLVRYLIGYGPIKSISNIRIDGKAISTFNLTLRPSNTTTQWSTGYQIYTGESNQPLSYLMNQIPGWTPTIFPGVASVIAIWPRPTEDAPDIFSFMADVEGLLIRDPQQDATLVTRYFSEDPALIIADIRTNKRYGGRMLDSKLNWDILVSETCPFVMQMMGNGKPRYPIGIVINSQQNLDKVVQNICEHAQLFETYNSGLYNILADMPRAWSGISFDDNNILPGSILRTLGTAETFERVDIEWTDSEHDWKQKTCEVELPGLGNSNVPIDTESKPLYGTREFQQANRIGIYHLNKSQLDLVFTWKTNLSGTRALPGDVVRLSSTELNLLNQEILVMDCEPENGVWTFKGVIYDDAVYSDTIVTNIVEVHPALPSPHDTPDAPTALTFTDESYIDANGQSAYRVKVSFTAPTTNYTNTFYRLKIRKTPYGGSAGPWLVVQENANTTYYIYDAKKGDVYEAEVTTVTEAPYFKSSAVASAGPFTALTPAGPVGPQGPQGPATYTWIKYADSPTTGMSDSPTGKAYIGLAPNKTTSVESSVYADYTWSKILGDQGVQGPAGPDGQPTYTWIKYGTSSTGAGLSDDPTGKTYIGLAHNKTTAVESTVASDYTWAKFEGPQGPQGAAGVGGFSVVQSNESHTLPADSSGVVTSYAGANTVIKAYSGVTEVVPTLGVLAPSTGVTASKNDSTKTVTITALANANDSGYVDIPVTYGTATQTIRFTVSKSKQGNTGTTGENAKTLRVFSDGQIITYDETGVPNPSNQVITIGVQKQNTTAQVTWTAVKLDGSQTPITPVTNLLSSSTGDQVTMSASNFNTQVGAYQGILVTATLVDGPLTLVDRVSIVKVQKGANGAGLVTFVPHGTDTVFFYSPNSFGKTTGDSGWLGGVYSAEKYLKGLFLSFRVNQVNKAVVMGLNTDPTTDANFTSLDYAFYARADGNIVIQEAGAGISIFGTYTTDTLFTITYDGISIRYYVDGVLVRTTARTSGTALHFDSSFFNTSTSAQVRDVVFGPMGEKGDYGPALMTLVPYGTYVPKLYSANSLGKDSGAATWAGGAYSQEKYSRGCYATFRPTTTNTAIMAGLSTSPLVTGSYTDIDFAFYLTATGAVQIYELGTVIGTFGTYTASTVFSITYDGVNVRYLKDGVVQRTVARSIGSAFQFDSSFNTVTPGVATLVDIAFGPTGEQGNTGPANFTLVAAGAGTKVFSSNAIGKETGANAWDASVYSLESYQSAFVSFTLDTLTGDKFIGLNSDPLLDNNYTGIDFAWYFAAGTAYARGQNITSQTVGAFVVGDKFSIVADNTLVRWYQNGVLVRTVDRTNPSSSLYFDSSLAGVTGSSPAVINIAFGPSGNKGDDADKVIAVKDSMAGIGGRVLTAPTTKLAADLTTGATTISVDQAVFTNGGTAVLQKVVGGVQQTEFLIIASVASGTGPYTYTVTRNADTSGADAWLKGDTIVSLGITGSPFIDLYSVRGLKAATEIGPSMVGNIKTGAGWNAWEPRWAIGNLNGLYGYAADTFGAAFGVPTGAWLKVDPTNGVRIGFNATTKVSIDASGNASFAGAVTADSGTIGGWTIGTLSLSGGLLTLHSSGRISIASGAASYNNSSTYFWAGADGKFSLGTKLTFDGSTLELFAGQFKLVSTGIEGYNGTTKTGSIYITSGALNIVNEGTIGSTISLLNDQISMFAAEIVADQGLRADTLTFETAINHKYGSPSTSFRQIVGPQQPAVADATATVASVQTQLNLLLARLRTHGLIAT